MQWGIFNSNEEPEESADESLWHENEGAEAYKQWYDTLDDSSPYKIEIRSIKQGDSLFYYNSTPLNRGKEANIHDCLWVKPNGESMQCVIRMIKEELPTQEKSRPIIENINKVAEELSPNEAKIMVEVLFVGERGSGEQAQVFEVLERYEGDLQKFLREVDDAGNRVILNYLFDSNGNFLPDKFVKLVDPVFRSAQIANNTKKLMNTDIKSGNLLYRYTDDESIEVAVTDPNLTNTGNINGGFSAKSGSADMLAGEGNRLLADIPSIFHLINEILFADPNEKASKFIQYYCGIVNKIYDGIEINETKVIEINDKLKLNVQSKDGGFIINQIDNPKAGTFMVKDTDTFWYIGHQGASFLIYDHLLMLSQFYIFIGFPEELLDESDIISKMTETERQGLYNFLNTYIKYSGSLDGFDESATEITDAVALIRGTALRDMELDLKDAVGAEL